MQSNGLRLGQNISEYGILLLMQENIPYHEHNGKFTLRFGSQCPC